MDLLNFNENFDNPLSTTIRLPEMTKVATARLQPSRLAFRAATDSTPRLPFRSAIAIPSRDREGAVFLLRSVAVAAPTSAVSRLRSQREQLPFRAATARERVHRGTNALRSPFRLTIRAESVSSPIQRAGSVISPVARANGIRRSSMASRGGLPCVCWWDLRVKLNLSTEVLFAGFAIDLRGHCHILQAQSHRFE